MGSRLRYTTHAKDQMERRRITDQEVEYVHSHVEIETPGVTPDRVNLWGKTSAGRRLRITVPRNERDVVVTAVAPEEES